MTKHKYSTAELQMCLICLKPPSAWRWRELSQVWPSKLSETCVHFRNRWARTVPLLSSNHILSIFIRLQKLLLTTRWRSQWTSQPSCHDSSSAGIPGFLRTARPFPRAGLRTRTSRRGTSSSWGRSRAGLVTRITSWTTPCSWYSASSCCSVQTTTNYSKEKWWRMFS